MGEEAMVGAAAAGPAPPDRAALGSKKRRHDADDLGRVAEIVLVLAGLGQMRGGRDPTALEKGLAAEARQKLVRLCESLRPLDLFSSDAARVVAGDLGFNPSKDPMGSRAARRTSIAEKVLLTKKKMEESKTKEPTVQSQQHSSTNLPGSFGIRPDNRGAYFHGQHRVYVDKPGQVSITAGAFASGSHVVHHVPMVSSGSPMKQTHLSDVQQTATPLKLTSNTTADSPHFRLDMRSPPSTFLLHPIQANSPGNHSMDKTSVMSSVPSTSAAANRPCQGNKLVDHISIKGDDGCVISSPQTSSLTKVDQDAVVPATQTAQGHIVSQQLHDVNLSLPSSTLTNHNEIAKSVQKFLQPKVLDLPSWNPPSVDYMNKPLNCQVCKSSINDLESLLVCDACEKGVHLKCLKSYSHKTVSNVEWHCPKCLLSSNGKPLPPKYGKVTRSNSASKASSNSAVSHTHSEKRSEMTDLKSSHQGKAYSVSSISSYPSQSVTMVGRPAEPILERKVNPKDDQCNNSSLVVAKEDGSYTAAYADQNNPAIPDDGKVSTEPVVKFNSSHSHVESSNVSSKTLCHSQNTSSAQEDNETNTLFSDKDFNNGHQEIDEYTNVESTKHSISKETCDRNAETGFGPAITAKTDTTLTVDVSGTEKSNIPKSLNLHSVEWIGESIHHLDDKTYYQTCRISGLVYNLQDHVLFTDGDRCYPSKLKVLWEDSKNGLQFAAVNRFYFPSDLPAVVIRPSTPEYDEVYGSNDSCTVEAGHIHGPCIIVPPSKFKEENKMKSHIGDRNGVLCPVFLCRWFYDKSKALFQPMNDY